MEAVWSPKTLASYCNTTWCHNSEDPDKNLHYRENLKSHIHYHMPVPYHNFHLQAKDKTLPKV